MGIGDRLLTPGTKHIDSLDPYANASFFKKSLRCPCTFTNDPIEYMESYINYKLRPKQKNIVIDIFSEDSAGFPNYDVALIICGMRCLGLGTEILMHDGTLKKIEDIKIGDLVMGPDSKSRKVLNLSRGESELYEVKQSHAITYVINENHILSLKKMKKGYLNYPNILNIHIKDYFRKSRKFKGYFKGYKANFNNKPEKLSSLTIKPIGIGNYAGIEVDGDHLFCLSDYTVTHNSGKSIISGAMGSFLTHKLLGMEDPAAQLHQVPGQMLSAEFIATSEDQSKKTSYSAFCSILTSTPWWRKYIQWLLDRETVEGKETLYVDHQRRKAFKEKNIEVVALHSNSASIAGLTAYYCAFDELSRFDLSEGSIQQQSEKRTAQAVYFTASRAIASVSPFSKIVVTTSPMYEADFGMQLLTLSETVKAEKNKSYIETLRSKISANDKVGRMVGYHYTTFEMNPKSDENGNDVPGGMSESDPYFKSVKKLSPATFNRDYLAIPPSAISPFFEIPERIEDCVIKEPRPPLVLFENMYFEESTMTHKGPETRRYVGKRAFPQYPDKMTKYFICCDQGAVKDSFVVAMGHGEEVQVETEGSKNDRKQITRYKAVIDLVEAWIPDQDQKITVSFPNVEEVIRTIAGYFNIAQVVYDRWNSEESIQRLFSEGIYTTRLGATFQMYETLKLLIYSNMVELPKDNKLVMELRQLNNIKNKKVDHSSSDEAAGKDRADAVCRVTWCIYEDCIKDTIRGDFMLPQRHSFNSLRSLATAFEIIKNSEIGDAIWDQTPSGYGGGSVFGKDFIVRTNVVSNLK